MEENILMIHLFLYGILIFMGPYMLFLLFMFLPDEEFPLEESIIFPRMSFEEKVAIALGIVTIFIYLVEFIHFLLFLG